MLQTGAQHLEKEQVSKRCVSPSHREMNLEPCMDRGCSDPVCHRMQGMVNVTAGGAARAGELSWCPPHADKSRLDWTWNSRAAEQPQECAGE